MIKPRVLPPGCRIALVAPAGPLRDGAVACAVDRVRELGWEALVGRHAWSRHGYLAGPDEERLEDLQEALESAENDAIWCLRGGYGTMRLLQELDLSPLRYRPRPLIGFSDNTALHLAAYREGLVTFHGPHAAVSELPRFSLEGLRRMLERTTPAGLLPMPHEHPRPETLTPGVATGQLVGGNLSLLAATAGTPYQLSAAGSILFFEEVGEPAYRLDRLLTQLLLAGVFDGVQGVAVGAISASPDEGEGGPTPDAVVRDRLGGLGVPVAFGLPFGHVPESWTLPIGIRARLDATAGTLEILEPAVVDATPAALDT